MPTGGGGTRPADAGEATCSCSGGHPPAPAVSAADTNRPDTDLLGSDRGVRFRSHPDTGRSVRLGQDGRGPAAAVAARRQDRARRICSSALVKLPGQRSQQNECPDAWTPDAACRTPGAGTPRHGGHPRPPQGMGTLRQRPRWTAGARTVHHPGSHVRPERDPMCGTGQHARLTARSVGWGRPKCQPHLGKAAQVRTGSPSR
jgi:hypothetical protein